MLVQYHLFLSLLLVLVLYPFLGKIVWIAYLSSILIDIDHLYVYYKKVKKYGFKQTLKYAIGINKESVDVLKISLYPLHTIEFFILILILSIYYPIFILIFVGLIYHLIIDLLWDFGMYNKYWKYYSVVQYLKDKI